MTAAVRVLIDEGFQHLKLSRIQARVATGNFPSQAVCDRYLLNPIRRNIEGQLVSAEIRSGAMKAK